MNTTDSDDYNLMVKLDDMATNGASRKEEKNTRNQAQKTIGGTPSTRGGIRKNERDAKKKIMSQKKRIKKETQKKVKGLLKELFKIFL